MQLISIVYRYEFLRHVVRRAYLIMTFGVPMIVLIGFGIYALIESNTSTEEDTSTDSELQQTLDDLGPVGYVDVANLLAEPRGELFEEKVFRYPDEAAAEDALRDKDITSFFVVSEDYMETGEADLVAENFDLTITDDRNLFEAFLLSNFITDNTSAQLFIRLQNPLNLRLHTIERGSNAVETVDEGEELDQFWVAYAFSMILFMSTIISSGYLMSSVIEERETRMIEIIISSVRPVPLLAGKILAMGSLGLLQISAWLLTIVIVVTQLLGDSIDLGELEISSYTLLITVVYFVLGFLLIGAAYAGIGAVSGSLREGSQLLTVVVLPAVSPLWFISVIVNDPNGTIATVMSLIPLTAPVTMVIRATITTVPATEVVASLVLLSFAVFLFIWAAGRLFRVGVLLSGAMPSPRQIIRYIFETPPSQQNHLSKTNNL